MQERKIIYFRTAHNRCPIEEFLDSLPSKVAQKIIWVLRLPKVLGMVPSLYFSKMEDTDDIWEFRIKLGSNIYRLFAFWDENKIIVTHGFIKKSQKTPRSEIERAESYKKEYWLKKED